MKAQAALLILGLASAKALQYDQERALQYANFVGAAYCPSSSLEQWNCGKKCIPGPTEVQVCHGSVTKAFVAKWESQCLVTFEGTSNVEAFVKDMEIVKEPIPWQTCGGCQVHSGFLEIWQSLRSCVIQQLNSHGCPSGSSIRTTGHSLGAALNALAMLDLTSNGWVISESYDFGMPRTGDEKFAQEFDNLFGQISFRVTHHMDPVPQVPPEELLVNWHYMHKEPEVFYHGDLSGGYKICTVPDDQTCSAQYTDLALDLLNLGNHLVYLGVETSLFGCSLADAAVVI